MEKLKDKCSLKDQLNLIPEDMFQLELTKMLRSINLSVKKSFKEDSEDESNDLRMIIHLYPINTSIIQQSHTLENAKII